MTFPRRRSSRGVTSSMATTKGGQDLAVVTVGTTTFSELLHAVLDPDCLALLPSFGVRRVLVQYGSLKLLPRPPGSKADEDEEAAWRRYGRAALGLDVRLTRYLDELDELLGDCNLAITHAGEPPSSACVRRPSLIQSP